MVKFINKLTGNAMYVADERKNEYLSAGHRLAGIQKRAEAPVKPVKKGASKKSGK